MNTTIPISTGIPELDRMFRGLIAGDNVVWRVDDNSDYRAFVEPYMRHAVRTGRDLVYFRFSEHPSLLPADVTATVYQLDPKAGFEPFLDGIHKAIEQTERRAYYVFDCLSDLASAWYSDTMLCNFFMLTCPYLYDRGDLAYFALLRRSHSNTAVMPIHDTAQIFIDAHRHDKHIYVRPLKTQQRYSPTMHMLHVWNDSGFMPVSDSCTIAEILEPISVASVRNAAAPMDVWDRTFYQAQELARRQSQWDAERAATLFDRCLRMVVSRDEPVLELVKKYFTLEDVLNVARRTIGTGLVGGKSVGMLLAQAILRKDAPRWRRNLEVHDSFYIASDVFYTFLVRNNCWWMRQQQKDPALFLSGAEQVRRRIKTGVFTDDIEEQFDQMLEYFGQSPIIVRSSSLLEDNFGNSFAGKYESVFCANQGSRRQRLEDFKTAVKTVYASAMSEKALSYRKRHGLLEQDEQMALLVQRVSGKLHGNLHYPHAAGVGFSFNPYVWNESIDPEAGVLRLVFGLGTRAVDRADDDYTRIVALNAPDRRPEGSREDVRKYSQHKVDILDLDANQLVSAQFEEVVAVSGDLPLHLLATTERISARGDGERGHANTRASQFLTFDGLLKNDTFVGDMHNMLQTLETAYRHPVDVEFTVNFLENDRYRVNVVQCRPLQVRNPGGPVEPPPSIAPENIVFDMVGPTIGPSRVLKIERIVFVVPEVYSKLPLSDKYATARLIGKLTHQTRHEEPSGVLLAGPGRWGTTTPTLGVPVAFPEIDTVSVLCEIVDMGDDVVPDVSLGTHFFSELVEMDILYLALFPHHGKCTLNTALLLEAPNRLAELAPESERLGEAIRVVDAASFGEGRSFYLFADTFRQRALCYLE